MVGIGIAAVGALVVGAFLGLAMMLGARRQPVPVRVRTLDARRTARGWVVDGPRS